MLIEKCFEATEYPHLLNTTKLRIGGWGRICGRRVFANFHIFEDHCVRQKRSQESFFFVPVLKSMPEWTEEDGISEAGVSDNNFASSFLFNLLKIASLH